MIMKQLRSEFIKNGVKFRIIERTQTRYLAEMYGEYGGCIGYETGRILQMKAMTGKIDGRAIDVQPYERIPSAQEFGKIPKYKGEATEVFYPPKLKDRVYHAYKLGQEADFEARNLPLKNKVVYKYPPTCFTPGEGKKSAYVPRVANTVQTA